MGNVCQKSYEFVNSFGENALISKFSIEGGIYKPIR